MRWRRSPLVLWRAAPGYLVLGTVSGHTIEVEGSGADVWARLVSWITQEEVTAALVAQYGAEARVVSLDVLSLLEALGEAGYVDRDD